MDYRLPNDLFDRRFKVGARTIMDSNMIVDNPDSPIGQYDQSNYEDCVYGTAYGFYDVDNYEESCYW